MTPGDAAYFFSIRLISTSLQWDLSQENPGSWVICSISGDRFIGILGIPIPRARVIGLPVPTPWRFILAEDDPEYFQCVQSPETVCIYSRSDHRISFPGTDLFLTLSNDDSSDAGTPILLEPYSGGENRMWKFQSA